MTQRMAAFLKRIHWPALFSAIVTLSGLLLDPAMLNVIPAKYSALLIGIGSALQLLTKYVLKPAEDAPHA